MSQASLNTQQACVCVASGTANSQLTTDGLISQQNRCLNVTGTDFDSKATVRASKLNSIPSPPLQMLPHVSSSAAGVEQHRVLRMLADVLYIVSGGSCRTSARHPAVCGCCGMNENPLLLGNGETERAEDHLLGARCTMEIQREHSKTCINQITCGHLHSVSYDQAASHEEYT